MIRKTTLFFSTLFILASCTDDENLFPRKADIDIMITASDNERQSDVETIVYGRNLELRTNSSGNQHLPYHQFYLDQDIPEGSAVNATYRDNSLVHIGEEFVPYTIEMTITIDGETALSEEYTVDEVGYTVSVSLFLPDYFSGK